MSEANYHKLAVLPVWERAQWANGELANEAHPYKWSGKANPPVVGERVTMYGGFSGPGTVVEYFVEYGWFGVMVKLDKPPTGWRKRNDGVNAPVHAFGVDLEPKTPDEKARAENDALVGEATQGLQTLARADRALRAARRKR